MPSRIHIGFSAQPGTPPGYSRKSGTMDGLATWLPNLVLPRKLPSEAAPLRATVIEGKGHVHDVVRGSLEEDFAEHEPREEKPLIRDDRRFR